MKTFNRLERLAWLLVAFSLIAAPLTAQHRRSPTAPQKPPAAPQPAAHESAATFDTLLAADSYKIYGEVRGVGQLVRSAGVNDLDPIMKLAAPPREFKTMVKWLNTHADALMNSRMLVAAWPAKANLPQFLCAIEFSSAEEAEKFEPQLRDFLPKLVPTPTPSPTSSASAAPAARSAVPPHRQKDSEPAPPYLIKHSGSLVLISESPFTLRNLRPAGSKLLAEDQNFRMSHDRFSSDSIFLYFNVALMDRESEERAKKSEEERKRWENELANRQKSDQPSSNMAPAVIAETEVEPSQPSPPPVSDSPQPTPSVTGATTVTLEANVTEQSAVTNTVPQPTRVALDMLSSAFFFGTPKWPEAFGVGLAFDADAYVVRTLLVSGPDNKPHAIPFLPQLITGPPLVPESPSILPADTELFVSASLDYSQMYEGTIKAIAGQNEAMRKRGSQTIRDKEAESPFAAYEKKLGIKLKEDLLPLLGNEIALTMSMKALNGSAQVSSPPDPEKAEGVSQKTSQPSEPSPVVAISIRDKEGARNLIPKIIESFGLKGASLLAQTEKRDDTELVSYANAVAYAFIGDFLVVSADVAATRHVVDSYLNHQTLASDNHFRNFTRWQPRQVLGQVYVSPALMESYRSRAGDMNDKIRDFLMQISPMAEPVTYALSNEGLGPLHEIHIPKNLVALMAAGIWGGTSESSVTTNEAVTKSALRTVASAETTYQATKGNGSFGSLDELAAEGFVSKELTQNYGYKIDVTVSSNKFEISAVPVEYGKSGKMSYFLDESSVLRGGDHGGGQATIADRPVQ